jgi:hypothetical protein
MDSAALVAANNPVSSVDIVNLGFVINVTEDFDERVEALARAWSLAERIRPLTGSTSMVTTSLFM